MKIICPDMSPECRFAWDRKGYYIEATGFMFPDTDLFALAVLNSRVVNWYFRIISPSVRGSTLRFKRVYMEPIPIPKASVEQRTHVESLVEAQLNDVGAASHDAQIEAAIARLYNLTEADISLLKLNHA
jgi:adenine-specific DNA-methyltransferase